MDTLRAMETFVRIVDAGSLTRAAAALNVSPPSVVRTLAALERRIETRLLNRTTRRIALTDEGREYYERCKRVLAEIDEAHAALSARRRAPRGRLRITASVMFGRTHVAPLLTDFLARHAEVNAELLLYDRVVDLFDEGLDLAVRIGALPDSSLVAVPVGATRRVVCGAPGLCSKQGVLKAPDDLQQRPCVVFAGLAASADWWFAKDGKPLRVAVQPRLATNQIDAAIDACTRGLGYGQFLHYQVEPLIDAGTLTRVLRAFEPEPVPVNLLYPQTRLLSANVRAFIDWAAPRLRQRLGGDSGQRAQTAKPARAPRSAPR